MAKTGRPPKLTPEVSRVILEGIAAGVPKKYAARRAGVGESTLRAWCARGKAQRTGEFRALLAALKKAEAEAVSRNVAIVRGAAKGGPTACRTIVRRPRSPGRWRRRCKNHPPRRPRVSLLGRATAA